MQSHILPVAVIVLLTVMIVIIATKAVISKPRYKAVPLLTPNETEFFERLRRALPETSIFPQVAMSAIIQPRATGKQRVVDLRRISQKRFDYAVYDKHLTLLAVVELDDRTHDSARDAVRDAYLSSAGIRTIRFQSKAKPDLQKIRAAFFPSKSSNLSTVGSSLFAEAGEKSIT
ncbi:MULTISPECIES: DUF2726 domain-containing protein [unclassified Caballeronia]|uniref:DUF2726 domain-containing protein n=1 Tax=unclassified Caballeronia TaxID=2646786 RepID=UPI00285C02E7|nr:MULTISPECIES: DUF2726 domain-containing protein [unclassified Caballeronia]MDR5777134.1 DUF2726 domain-containing protein [Caballeronia sp. LZ002]MDR5798710.1 DUF2726 domain-containing protein [Caballeronia sp. LZ001]MDR5852533.1 DUF2726 domain-containing protein [Caballeronia sp. LZ003]